MLHKLIPGRQKPLALILMMAGIFSGLLLMLGSAQIYLDIKGLLLSKSELIQPQYMVINKKVSLLNTFSIANSSFSKTDIEDIRAQKEVKKAGAFTAAHYSIHVSASAMSRNFPIAYSDLFLESVPDEYLDINKNAWHWKPGDETLPVVIPNDYLNLYNFGFAPGQHLPQLTKGTIGMVGFEITAEGRQKKMTFNGRIAGFTNRINSILVPESFMVWSNREFGDPAADNHPNRLILMVSDPSSPSLLHYLEDEGYETNTELLRNSRLTALLTAVTSAVMVVAGLIIALSLLNFIQYAQLLIQRSSYEIRILILMGYYITALWRRYMAWYAAVLAMIFIAAAAALYAAHGYLYQWMYGHGYEIATGLKSEVLWYGIITLAVLIFMQGISLYISIRRLAR